MGSDSGHWLGDPGKARMQRGGFVVGGAEGPNTPLVVGGQFTVRAVA